jgi:hypothetical protein
MVLISTVVGGLFLYVIFERYLKKSLHRTHDHRKIIEDWNAGSRDRCRGAGCGEPSLHADRDRRT